MAPSKKDSKDKKSAGGKGEPKKTPSKGESDRPDSSKAEDKADGGAAAAEHDDSGADDASSHTAAAAGGGGVPLPLLKKLVNQAAYADVAITTSGSGKGTLHAHKFILDQRCPKLAGLVKKDRKGGKADMGPLDISHETMEKVMQFIYTDDFDFKGLSDNAVIDLNFAASKLELSRLKWLASNHLQQTLSLKNVYAVLKKVKEDGQEDLCDLAIGFALKNYSAFVHDKTGCGVIGVETFSELVRLKESNSFDEPDLGPFPDQTIENDMRKIRENAKNADLTLIVSDKKTLACHRAILGNHSKPLANFVADAKEKKELPPAMVGKTALPVLSEQATNALLDWCYFGEHVSDPFAAAELVPWCHTHELPRLWEISEQTVLHNINDKTVMKVLDVAYLPCMAVDHKKVAGEMKTDGISYTLDHLTSIDLTPLKKMNPNIPRDILVAEQERQQAKASASASKEEPKSVEKKAEAKAAPEVVEPAPEKKAKKAKRSSSSRRSTKSSETVDEASAEAGEPVESERAAPEEVAAPASDEPSGETHVAESSDKPAESDDKPAESDVKPVESEDKSAAADDKPAEPEPHPAESGDKPADAATAETTAPADDAVSAEPGASKSSKKPKKAKKSSRKQVAPEV